MRSSVDSLQASYEWDAVGVTTGETKCRNDDAKQKSEWRKLRTLIKFLCDCKEGKFRVVKRVFSTTSCDS